MLSKLILLLLFAGTLVYSLLSVMAAARYLAASALKDVEPISVLKPLAGLDDGLAATPL